MNEFLSNPSALYVVAAIVIGLLIIKKLIKWALIIGLVGVLYYLNTTGALDSIKSQIGL